MPDHSNGSVKSPMPKRSNEFQRLVYLVQVNLAEGATVTESKMLPDSHTGTEREADVHIEGKVGGNPVRVSIECRDHARPADIGWVEMMKAKHERLPTNALILASRLGFTREAKRVAKLYGIETISFHEIDQVAFPELLAADSTLWFKTITLAARGVSACVAPTETLAAESTGVMPDNIVYAVDGHELGTMLQVVQSLLNSQAIMHYICSTGTKEHVYFEAAIKPVRVALGYPIFLKNLEPVYLREIGEIHVQGPCEIKINEFGFRSGKLGDVNLIWGKTDFFDQKATVVVTRDKENTGRVTVALEPQPNEQKSSKDAGNSRRRRLE